MAGGASYVFDAFELDIDRVELRYAGRAIEVQPQVWQALLYLVRNAGRAVSKEELLDEAWGDAIVTDGAISQVISLARRALNDDGSQQRYIKTLRGHGFRFDGQVRRIAPPPRGRASSAFVGRDGEIAAILDRYERAREGSGSLLLIGGGPGIGKTTLVEQLAHAVVDRGGKVHIGRSLESEGSAAFAPWVQILSDLWSGQRARLHPRWLAGIDRMLPELAAEIRLPDPDAASEGAGERFRIFDAVARLVRDGIVRPSVFVLEDLHAADESTLLFLEFLTSRLADHRLLVVGTYRDTEVSSPVLRRLLGEPMELEGIAVAAVGEVLASVFDAPVPDALVRDTHEVTAGNPLFVSELARTAQLEGGLAALPRILNSLRIPDPIAQAIQRGLQRLPAPTRAMLAIAAVVGRDFDLAVLRRAADVPAEVALERIGPAIEQRWIRETSVGTFRFAHALIREALHAELLPAQRAQHHARVAEALEWVAPARSDDQISRLAHHWFLAVPAGAPDKALEHLTGAARAAHRRFAYEEAATWLDRALQVQRVIDPAPGERIDLQIALGVSLRCAGDASRAMSVLDQASELALTASDAVRLAQATDEYAAAQKNVFDPALIGRLERALAALSPEATELRTRLTARLAIALTFAPDARRADELGRGAVETARAFGPRTLALALFARRWSLHGRYTPHERLAIATEAVATALAAGDRAAACEARTWTVSDLLELGRRDDADRELAAQAREAAELHQPWHELITARFRVVVALCDGRFAEAETLSQEALALGTKSGDQNSHVIYWIQMIVLRREQGRYGELEPFAKLMGDLTPWSPSWRCLLADVLCETGRPDEARAIVAALAPDDFAAIPHDVNRPVAIAMLANAVATLGDAANAEVLYRIILPDAPYHVVVAGGSLYLGPVERLLGRLCLACGRIDEAIARLEAAMAACDHIRAPAWKARTQLDAALAHRARGDHGVADQLVLTARAAAERMGMVDLVARCDALKFR